MRTQRRNKQTLKYATLRGKETIYKLDENGDKVVDYVDTDGTVYYQTIGEKQVYNDPVELKANISMSGSGENQATEYGVDVTKYDATVIYDLHKYPITETTLIWHESDPEFEDGYVDPASADYKVLRIKDSLNFTKLILGRLAKNHSTSSI